MPYGLIRCSKSSILPGVPASMTVSDDRPTSTILPSNTPTSWITCPRSAGPAATVRSNSSPSVACSGASSVMLTTLTSLSSWRTICSSGADSTSTTMVIRLKRSSSVGATASEKML